MKPTVVMIHGPDPTLRVGGGERYVCAHARAARRAGYDVHVFCVSDRPGIDIGELGTLHRVWSPVRPFRNLMARWHAPFLTRGLRRFLASRRGPHVLHAFTSWAAVAVRAAAASPAHAPCAAVATVWDSLYEEAVAKLAGVDPSQGVRGKLNPAVEVAWTRLVMRRYEGRAWRRCRSVFVNYDSIERHLVARYGVAPARIRRLPYASEAAFLPPGNAAMPGLLAELRATGVPVILVMSRHVPRKGLAVLLQALASLHHEQHVGFRACFVGGGYLLDHHRQLVSDLGLADVVRIVGRVPESFDYVRHADLFVLPSLEEGSGSMSMIEAMQAGVPIVATRIDGIPEDVTDGDNALLVEPGQAAPLAAAIRRLIDDPALRRRLGDASRETFERRFSANALTRGLDEAYGEVEFSGNVGRRTLDVGRR